MAQIVLMPGRDRPLTHRHPWIFAAAVDRLVGRARPGDTVDVLAANGRPLARAAWSPQSKIRGRVWTFDPQEVIDDAFFKRRVEAAVQRRRLMPELRGQEGLRLVHGESDGLPGVIADGYRDTVVVQLTSAGADKWRKAIVRAVQLATGCARIFDRSDSEVRRLEGLEPVTGWALGEAPDAPLSIVEYGVRMRVDVVAGHKTGFYLDQRENRLLTRELARGRLVLNCFCYTGGFSLQALAGGARHVLSIDSSAPALRMAEENLAMNPELRSDCVEWREADVFEEMRALRSQGRRFDLVILDPPKFAPSIAHAERAARAYRDINVLGLRLLNPGGLLMSFSCSGGIRREHFQQIVAEAAVDSGREVRIRRRLAASLDHPVLLSFSEGEYLKGLLCEAD
ncbi:class I SAM-dependent rRNA methyltransferase [Accumulibacter sp.]|uniref:class I SAM-dependent rRNA methyltransferase n=1 Tax=Accumulibacter sp. TaxID=2053492 RepID=UPI0025F46481|nr:class I SAM-dependent methyltransferase [Accumulibacter sp.]MCM8593766.1 class I SAM-dependent methyltransferase [Accumulibacter sp.]MCM8627698.1 class I SAM-dependent methyltransferase [Accumulibacter sp.]MDS4047906.1 class I SAM-dependent methyltransferase [Accumulibacter sp.]